MRIELAGKRALVTGGSSGIGKAIALAFAEAGADVAINHISGDEEARAVVGRIEELGRRGMALKADISDADAVSAMFARIEREWNAVDILVNNAGIDGKRAMSWEIDLGDWRKVIEVDLFGAFHCARLALKPMIARGSGVVLNITSVHEAIPWAGYGAYTAAKAALSMLTKTMAQEAAPHGVRVFSIAPGAIKTRINEQAWEDQQGYRDLMSKIPANRMGDVRDVARMALILCSDAASYLMGSTVYIDGGMMLYPAFERGG
ncbi:MAG TPA: glucose 1-dehydrogenase [Burkholderiales bacterium]|nr:glucose 1-dehydrogenase [Burkholderiales bacterium]